MVREGRRQGRRERHGHLGLLYANGQGVAQDYGKAREWYEKAVDKGDAYAMPTSACFTSTVRVAQDYAKAREWYEKAADKGDASAMANLGLLYATVRAWRRTTSRRASGSRRPPTRATRRHGQPRPALRNGQGVAQDYAKAREWYEKAAAKDNVTAMINLGRALRERSGRGAGLR